MMRLLIVTLLCTSALGGALPKNKFKFFKDFDNIDRIVGGVPATVNDAPWQVAMLRALGTSLSLSCGGSIIKSNVILSAANCIYGTTTSVWRARAGSIEYLNGGQLVSISNYTIHENYGTSSNTYDHDIGFYITSTNFDLSGPTVKAIALPAQDQSVDDGTIGLITGWGATINGGSAVAALRKTNIPIVNQELCASSYGGSWITDRMMCLGDVVNGGIGACHGDGGGPFAINNTIFGVTSWGSLCAAPGYPGVWVRVAYFRNWLDTNMPQGISNF